MRRFVALAVLLSVCWFAKASDLPAAFDLRHVNGQNFVTAVRSQQGGTCWTHGTMASIESNLMVSGAWTKAGETGEPGLAEYHLDWWNGFNQHYNADIAPETGGLEVHEGGDYRVAAAYLARGEGAVRKSDGQSFETAPDENNASYHHYYVRDIDWLVSGNVDRDRQAMKQALMENGAIGTAIAWGDDFYSSDSNSFYQPADSNDEPNHSVTIVGWDDSKQTQAPQAGAWLVKNSWGTDWGDGGFFWLSYADKYAGKHPQMGAVSFHNTEPMRYQQVYYHDYHGWRDTKGGVTEAFNAFTAKGGRAGFGGFQAASFYPGGIFELGNWEQRGQETIRAVSFYTADQGVQYTAKVFSAFNGDLSGELSSQQGTIAYPGLHTVDLDWPVKVQAGEKFFVYLALSKGGQPYDKTSDVPVLLGARSRTVVTSKASPGESFYRSGSTWVDLTQDNSSANFCMKALTNFE